MNQKNIDIGQKKWRDKTLAHTQKRMRERRTCFQTDSEIPLPELATPIHCGGDESYLEQCGFPGEAPFTRGVQPNMYRGRFWTMRQYAGFGTAKESNERYRYLLSQGTTGLSVAFDLPTQMGLDSDHPLAAGEVGRTGVAIDSLKDMEVLFDQIPLDQVSTSMTINATAAILLSMYVAVGDARDIKRDKLRGTIQNDILKEYIARGTYIFPPRPSMRLVTDTFAFCKAQIPQWNTISISGYHIREAGSDAVQEVAFTLADGIAYVQAAIDVGLEVDEFAPRLAFFFNAHNNLCEEIAKFRAARRVWCHIMRDRFGAKNPKSMALRFHTQTAGSTLTAQQPLNNIVRVTIQALAATLGGTQSLHTNAYDEALALPTEESVRVALRTQQIVAHESGIADLVDPLAGSYAIEYLTDEIERRSLEYIRRIDEVGGMIAAIESGFVQREIQRRAFEYQKSVEQKKRIIMGVNDMINDSVKLPNLHQIDSNLEKTQKMRLTEFKSSRDQNSVKRALAEIRHVARSSDNLVPCLLNGIKALCTIGEISGVLREVFGTYEEVVTL
ncbi:MAG: methylmalonyl-CoA mutase family protein [Pseudomonadota bacterium]